MDHEFYSSREERLQSASSGTKRAYEKRNSKSIFKRNPGLRILVIDLLLVLLFATIIIPFFIRITKDIRIDDYKIVSKAILFNEEVLVSIKVSNLYKKIQTRKTTDKLKVDIIKNNSIIQSNSLILPINDGEDKYLTFKLVDNITIKEVNIKLTSGDYIKEYKVQIEH